MIRIQDTTSDWYDFEEPVDDALKLSSIVSSLIYLLRVVLVISVPRFESAWMK